jgi:hypothetical protein
MRPPRRMETKGAPLFAGLSFVVMGLQEKFGYWP